MESASPIQLAFAHANSYPAASYQPLFDALTPQFELHAHPKLGHDPLHPVTDCWPALVREYEQWLLARIQASHPKARWLLIGHSMGGYLSLMVAARQPKQVAGVILLDAPIVGGWQAGLLWAVKRLGLANRFSPARFALGRRERFEHAEHAFQHFRRKAVFAQLTDTALRHYIDAGLVPVKEGNSVLKLAFDRRIEARIYATLPHAMARTARTLQALQAAAPPISFVAGAQSYEVKQVGLRYTRWLVPQERLITLEGTHLFPLERPALTAQAVTQLAAMLPKPAST
jgi:pimeloyl-ACP methyl ester carboxylesterase